MDLSIYQVIKGPVFSTKAFRLNQTLKKLTLEVHPQATRSQIREALKKLFNIEKVIKINIVSRQGKMKYTGSKVKSKGIFKKRAIITLAEGQSEALSQTQMMPQAQTT